MYVYHSFLIHSSADGHLGCFHVMAIINSVVMNIGVHMSLSDLVSSLCMPSIQCMCILLLYIVPNHLLGHMAVLFPVFKESSHCSP